MKQSSPLKPRSRLIFLGVVAGIAIMVLGGLYLINRMPEPETEAPGVSQPIHMEGEPQLVTETVVEGLNNVWDIAQAPDKTLFYTERAGVIGAVLEGKATTIYEPKNVVDRGEGGMMGMTLDPAFEENRYLYVCYNTPDDIRVVRFKVAQDNDSLGSRSDIVTDMPVNPSGRHSGCRPVFGPDNYLWIGTGDTARSQYPQSPTSLGGKILRVNREGKAAPGNLIAPFDTRIFSFGHRNVQGLAFYGQPRGDVIGYSVEHGTSRNDEVNVLEKGNFGWDPGRGYDERAPMTDTAKFPNAIRAIWSSGQETIAPSGAAILKGSQWKDWEGRMMMAVLKDRHVRLLDFGPTGRVVTGEEEILNQFGRVRTVVQGADGNAYLSTDNGNGSDKIIKVTPH